MAESLLDLLAHLLQLFFLAHFVDQVFVIAVHNFISNLEARTGFAFI